ncbi:MAG: D-aminoacyl-tRNA deacylase [Anaerolineales bacterium]
MKALVQRVRRGSVSVAGETLAAIGPGLVVLLGVGDQDSDEEASWLATKCANLRIFEDDDGKMNRSLLDSGGGALVVSQFTLYGDVSKGRRPSFVHAAHPDVAEPLVEKFAEHLRREGVETQTGSFGADMLVEIDNDGPVTLMIERSSQ